MFKSQQDKENERQKKRTSKRRRKENKKEKRKKGSWDLSSKGLLEEEKVKEKRRLFLFLFSSCSREQNEQSFCCYSPFLVSFPVVLLSLSQPTISLLLLSPEALIFFVSLVQQRIDALQSVLVFQTKRERFAFLSLVEWIFSVQTTLIFSWWDPSLQTSQTARWQIQYLQYIRLLPWILSEILLSFTS